MAFLKCLKALLIPLLFSQHDRTVENSFNEFLMQKEKQAWHELSTIGIYRESIEPLFLREIKNYTTKLPSKIERLSQETINCIHQVMNDFGIDPSSISIVESDEVAIASALDSTLTISPSSFLVLPSNAQAFVIAHELQHIIYKDSSFCHFIKQTIKKYNLPLDAYFKYVRFIELRADIKAAIRSKEYALGYKAFVEELTHSQMAIAHLSQSERISQANEILAQFN
jgi:hypothetical protein